MCGIVHFDVMIHMFNLWDTKLDTKRYGVIPLGCAKSSKARVVSKARGKVSKAHGIIVFSIVNIHTFKGTNYNFNNYRSNLSKS